MVKPSLSAPPLRNQFHRPEPAASHQPEAEAVTLTTELERPRNSQFFHVLYGVVGKLESKRISENESGKSSIFLSVTAQVMAELASWQAGTALATKLKQKRFE